MPTFSGTRGAVHHDSWLPQREVRSVVVFLHGFGEHLGLYEAFADRLTADGHAVHALDCVGHGRSEGERGSMTWDAYPADASRLVHLARDRHPDVPLVLAGHSGGALAAYLVALREPTLADALVLSGAPLGRLDWVGDMLAVDPSDATDATGGADGAAGADGGELDPTSMLSTHPDYVHALLHDPLVHGGDFSRAVLESLAGTWAEVEAGLGAGLPDLPVLVVHGELDPVVPVTIAQRVAQQLPRAELVTFPGDLHDVLNEHDRDAVHDVVAGFVGRVSASASPAA